MPDHCRECRAMRSMGACDCAALLSGRAGSDAIAKPLLISALGAEWMGMEDLTMSTEWKPVRVRGLESELKHAEETLGRLDRERDECRDRIAHLKQQIVKETGPYQQEASGD